MKYSGAIVDKEGFIEYRFSFIAANARNANKKAGDIAKAWSKITGERMFYTQSREWENEELVTIEQELYS